MTENWLTEIIVCPQADHGRLEQGDNAFTCSACGATYELRNGIPVLLPAGA